MKDAHNAFNFSRPQIESEILERARQVAFVARKRAAIADDPMSLPDQGRDDPAFGGAYTKPRARAVLKLRYPPR